MSSYTPHMNADDVLYRGVLAYEEQNYEWAPDPSGVKDHLGRVRNIRIPVGQPETKTDIIGPYHSVRPIKSYITRRRSNTNNLRLVRIEKTVGWEEVSV